MCLAIPAKITDLLAEGMARVDIGGIEQEISLELVDGVGVGDYVIVHVGYALQKLDESEARETLAIIDEALSLVSDRGQEGSR